MSEVQNETNPKKARYIVAAVVVAILACAYLAGVMYFSNVFFPRTCMGDHDISLKTSEEAESIIAADTTGFELTVSGEGLAFTIPATSIALSLDANASALAAKSSVNPWIWPFALFSSHDASECYATSVDETALLSLATSSVEAFNATATLPVDATIAYDASVGAFVIKPEMSGTVLNVACVVEQIEDAVHGLKHTCTIGSNALVLPTIYGSDARLAAGKDQANGLLAVDVVLKFDGVEVYKVGAADAATWITFDSDFHAAFDESALDIWAQAMDTSLNSVGASRTYTLPTGKIVTVSGGTYGWQTEHVDWASVVKASRDTSTQQVVDVSVSQSAAAYRGPSAVDWGRFCDIDLTDQYARFYDENGVCLWETEIVSGRPWSPTPEGVWMCNLKASPCTLTGRTLASTGQPEYVTTVKYWMPFVKNSIGLHDATWQSSFGGTRYEDGYGSHGCVNLSYDAAAEIYGIIEVGDTVITHS